MADPFVGEIRIFAGNFPPLGWALCDGTLLPISQNTALFSLLGTSYGGDGKSTFALPDLRDATPLGTGQGPGLTPRTLGERAGEATVTLLASQLPTHAHLASCDAGAGASSSPAGNTWAAVPGGAATPYAATAGPSMGAQALAPSGGGLPHDNRSPYLGVTFIIALQGIFPPRT